MLDTYDRQLRRMRLAGVVDGRNDLYGADITVAGGNNVPAVDDKICVPVFHREDLIAAGQLPLSGTFDSEDFTVQAYRGIPDYGSRTRSPVRGTEIPDKRSLFHRDEFAEVIDALREMIALKQYLHALAALGIRRKILRCVEFNRGGRTVLTAVSALGACLHPLRKIAQFPFAGTDHLQGIFLRFKRAEVIIELFVVIGGNRPLERRLVRLYCQSGGSAAQLVRNERNRLIPLGTGVVVKRSHPDFDGRFIPIILALVKLHPGSFRGGQAPGTGTDQFKFLRRLGGAQFREVQY